jgi:hypothetical protein
MTSSNVRRPTTCHSPVLRQRDMPTTLRIGEETRHCLCSGFTHVTISEAYGPMSSQTRQRHLHQHAIGTDLYLAYLIKRGTRWRSWLRHCSKSWKVAVSITDGVIEIFH